MDTKAQQQAARANRNLIRNPAFGHEKGQPFDVADAEINADAKLDGIAVWTHNVGDQPTIKSLKVHWNDGDVVQYGDANAPKPDQVMLFDDDEKLRKCAIYTGDAVDALYLETNKRAQRLGGPGGQEHQQSVGDGNLVGFYGKATTDVQQLGTIFETGD